MLIPFITRSNNLKFSMKVGELLGKTIPWKIVNEVADACIQECIQPVLRKILQWQND